MGFVLEQLTDDQREQMGFARNTEEVKKTGYRASFVHQWVIDKEKNIFLVKVHVNQFELHFQNKVVLIKAPYKETLQLLPCTETGVRKYDYEYTVTEIDVPKDFSLSLETINDLLVKSLKTHWNAGVEGLKYKGKIDVRFSDEIKISFRDKIKSQVKLSDFKSVQ